MSARVFVHPRCVPDGEANTRLCETLAAHGFDLDTVMIGPRDFRGRCELVHLREMHVDGSARYERMDGTQFIHGGGRCA